MTDGRALKHVQVREYVRNLVTGSAPGSPAPSERELVQHFGVARMTVRQAMDALVVEGLLERIPGRGTFVARPRRTARVPAAPPARRWGRTIAAPAAVPAPTKSSVTPKLTSRPKCGG